jgi:hypothetical protein
MDFCFYFHFLCLYAKLQGIVCPSGSRIYICSVSACELGDEVAGAVHDVYRDLYVCMCVCVCVYVYIYIYIYIYTVCVYMYIYIFVRFLRVNLEVKLLARSTMSTVTCMYVCVCVSIYIHIYIYTHTMCAYICIYTFFFGFCV